MTKQQPCATKLPPSRLCRLLLIAFALKLTVLGMLIADPILPGGVASFFGADRPEGVTAQVLGPGTAVAATNTGAAAPPSLEAKLPDVGMDRPTPGQAALSGPPGAAPFVMTPEEAERALPTITQRPAGQAADGTASGLQNEARDALARRQEDLARKEQELRVLESELSTRLEKMKMLENRLASMIKDAEETNDAKFRHLVDVLANMKSRQAAAVLETLDPKIGVRVLAGMRGRQAGEILTYVRPEIAAQLTESLAHMQLPLE